MNYQKLYNSIIAHAKNEIRSKDDNYYERHHIIPKSLGGSNKKENLVHLTAREHFICHLLLVKIHINDMNNYKRMLHAFMLMKGQSGTQVRYVNSKLYESLKRQYSIIRSKARAGVAISEEQKKILVDRLAYARSLRKKESENKKV